MGLLDSIKKAFSVLPDMGMSLGKLALIIVIIGVLVGVFVYQATTGTIQVDGTYNATSNTGTGSLGMIAVQSSNLSTVVSTLWSAATSVTGFIVIAVIVVLAAGFLGRNFLGGGNNL